MIKCPYCGKDIKVKLLRRDSSGELWIAACTNYYCYNPIEMIATSERDAIDGFIAYCKNHGAKNI